MCMKAAFEYPVIMDADHLSEEDLCGEESPKDIEERRTMDE